MFKVSNRVKIVFILVLIVSTFVVGQDKQDKQDKQLREEILAAYKSGGDQGLRHFVKKQKDKISNKFIVDFAETGVKERKIEWLNASKIMAEEKKDEKKLADVLYNTGRYFSFISDFKKAVNYFDKAFPIYLKLNDPVGTGNVYFRKGITYSKIGDNLKALEMLDKALPFFEKADDQGKLGKLYHQKGMAYYEKGDKASALEMFKKACFFYEKAGDLLMKSEVELYTAMIYFDRNENSKALEILEEKLHFYEKLENAAGIANVCCLMGDIFLIIGENELKKKKVMLKEMGSGTESLLGLKEVIKKLK